MMGILKGLINIGAKHVIKGKIEVVQILGIGVFEN